MTQLNVSADAIMAAERAIVREKIEAHFNNIAAARLHADLVEIALDYPASLLQREERRQELFALIEAASTPAEIATILSTL